MTVSPCPRYEPELSAYLDGETPSARRAEIESHLRVCDACRAAVARLRGVSRALRRWDAQETRYATSTGFRSRVYSQIGVEDAPASGGFAWRAAAAAALVAAGATGSALVARRFGSDDRAAYERLAAQVAQIEAEYRTRPVEKSADPAAPPAAASVDPLPQLRPIVAPLSPEDAAATPEAPPDVYEQRGDWRFLREALPDHESYARERDSLELREERQRRMQESSSQKSPETVRATTQAAPAPSPLATFLGEARLASGSFGDYQKVQVWPIETSAVRASDAARPLACEKAVAQQILRVTESPTSESVVVENRDAKRPVLVLAGDVLVGGRRDRMAREDVLVGPGDQLSIPTYGSGRSLRTSYTHFTSVNGIAPQELRALVAADRALLSGGIGQDRFDDFVAETLRSLSSPSGRGTLDNLFTNPMLVDKADLYERRLGKRLEPANVVGFAVTAGGKLLGAEIFGDHATFADQRSRLLRSYVLAAIASSPDGTRLDGAVPSRDAVAAVLASAPKGVFPPQGTPSGSGTLVAFRGGVEGGPFGFGLLDGAHVVHAAWFTSVPDGADPAAGAHAGPHRGVGGADAGGAEGGARPSGTRGGPSSEGDGATDAK